MTKFKNNITKSIDNLNILQHDLELVYGDELETNIDNMLINNIDTKSGSNLTYNKTVDSAKLDFDIIGNCEQDGTPTPDAPIPVKVVTGDNDVIISNRNLVNYDNTPVTLIKSTSRTVTITPDNFPITLPAGTYTMSIPDLVMTNNAYNFSIQLFKSGGYSSTSYNNSKKASTFTLSEETTFVRLYGFISVSDNDNATATFSKIQLETGDVASNYIPYKENKHTLHLADLELCKIGDYSDKIVKTATGWNLIKNINKINNVENLFRQTGIGEDGNRYVLVSKTSLGLENDVTLRNVMICNKFNENLNKPRSVGQFQTWSNRTDVLFIVDSQYNNIESIKQAYPNIIAYCVLAEPVETPITDTTLIADLNALYNDAVTYQNQTNIITVPDTDNAQMLIDASVFVTEKEV